MKHTRTAGVLMPVSSFEGTLGIGDFGQSAYDWINQLADTGATIWQILPLNPVGYGNSPYQTYSSFAGDEIYISIEILFQSLGLEYDFEPERGTTIHYDSVRDRKKFALLRAFEVFEKNDAYASFLEVSKPWLDEYVEFIALKKHNDNASWLDWTEFETLEENLEYERFVQFVFYEQWMDLKAYANSLGIIVVGDIPIYLGHDSAEVYHHRDQFLLNPDGSAAWVAGVPPDHFSDEGQHWGNPLYDWDAMAKDNYSLWIERLRWNQLMFDVIRIDHFRAFDTYWAIPGTSDTARIGEWRLGPRHAFFDCMYENIEDLNLVVEDLGDLRPEVLELRDDYNLMGMTIIQFNIKPNELKRDASMGTNVLVYTGTHDNQPIQGWVQDLTPGNHLKISANLRDLGINERTLWKQLCSYTLSLNADWAILPMQDLMGMGDETRINSPGTIGSPNWEWKLDIDSNLEDGFEFLAYLIDKHNR